MSSARKEAQRFLFPLHLVNALLFATWWFWPWMLPQLVLGLFILFVGAAFFVSYFFRDPEREVPADEKIIVSAADGLVVDVVEMEEPDFQLGRMRRVAVFLSVFDVHVNRSPVAGLMKRTTYKAGEFLDVRHKESSTRNECRSWLIETERGPVAVRQIAGLIARRIVAWSAEGDAVERGYRFGMIRFGSRTEIYVPADSIITAKVGDRVQGGASVIARLAQEKA